MALGPINGINVFMMSTTSAVTAAVSQIATQGAQVCVVSAGNTSVAARFLKFFDTNNANSGAGMTAFWQMIIPGNIAGAGTNLAPSPGPPMLSGLQHPTGLACAITLNAALADASGISGTNECFATIGWR